MLTLFIARLLLCLEHADNLEAYTASVWRPVFSTHLCAWKTLIAAFQWQNSFVTDWLLVEITSFIPLGTATPAFHS